nr:unnamed protein product [Callosobruchus analis]
MEVELEGRAHQETCRLCKEPSHLPLRCNEVEKDEEVKARVHVENKMTDALLRCPLYSDMDAMHQQEVAKAAEQAKKEVNPEKLKVDPSADIKEYYEDKRQKMKPPRWMEVK